MFKSEQELVDTFINHYQQKFGKTKFEFEVETPHKTKTDIVLIKDNQRISIEAKLNDIIGVWVQALRNLKWYDYSFVILPSNKEDYFCKKHLSHFKKNNIGVIFVNKSNFYVKVQPAGMKNVFINNGGINE